MHGRGSGRPERDCLIEPPLLQCTHVRTRNLWAPVQYAPPCPRPGCLPLFPLTTTITMKITVKTLQQKVFQVRALSFYVADAPG